MLLGYSLVFVDIVFSFGAAYLRSSHSSVMRTPKYIYINFDVVVFCVRSRSALSANTHRLRLKGEDFTSTGF